MNAKNKINISILLVLSFTIYGCSTSNINESMKINEVEATPTWVKTKQLNQKISELGLSKHSELSFNEKRDEAVKNAKQLLTDKLQLKIINIFKAIKDATTSESIYEEKVVKATIEIVNNSMNDSKLIKLWENNSKNIYVLVSIDIDTIKKHIETSFKTTFNDMNIISSNYYLSLEQGKIDLELKQ